MISCIVVTILFSILSAYCYRVGGMSYEEAQKNKLYRWLPKWCVHSWFRDYLCLLIALGWCYYFDLSQKSQLIRFLISAVLFKLAISTYWDDSKINWRKGKDNFYMHGFGIGLSLLPVAFSFWTVLYALALGSMMGLICDMTDNVYVEEYSRGWLIPFLLPILLLAVSIG